MIGNAAKHSILRVIHLVFSIPGDSSAMFDVFGPIQAVRPTPFWLLIWGAKDQELDSQASDHAVAYVRYLPSQELTR